MNKKRFLSALLSLTIVGSYIYVPAKAEQFGDDNMISDNSEFYDDEDEFLSELMDAEEDETITASGDCGDSASWKLTNSGTLYINGSGNIRDWMWNGYADSIKNVVIEDGITNIGNYSFYGCDHLRSIQIPSSVTSISCC